MKILIYTLFITVLLLAPRLQAADPEYVELDGGGAFQFSAQVTPPQVRIPLKVAKGEEFGNLVFQLIEVRRGAERTAALMNSFKLTTQPPPSSEKAAPSLLVDLIGHHAEVAGTYELRIAVTKTGAPDVRQELDLQVIQPAAQIAAPGLLRVKTVRPFLFGKGKTESLPFLLRETSKDAPLSNIQITMISASTAAGKPTTGSANFTAPDRVGAGKSSQIAYSTEGFPLGASSVKAEIDAPQLASKNEVQIDVQVVSSPWWAIALIVAGLTVGFVLRVVLARVLTFGNAKKLASSTLTKLREASQNRKDPTFRETVASLLGRLRDAVKSKDATKLTDEAAAIETELQAAMNTLNTTATAARAELVELNRLVQQRPWPLSPLMNKILDAVPLARANSEFDEGNPQPTLDFCGKVRSSLRDPLLQEGRQWKQQSLDQIDEFRNAGDPLTEALRAPFDPSIGEIETALNGIPDPVDATVESMTEFLEKVKDARTKYVRLTDLFTSQFHGQLSEWVRKLAEAPTADPTALKILNSNATQFWEAIAADKDDPNRVIELFLSYRDTLRGSIRSAIQAATSEPGNSELITALDEGRYKDAILCAVNLGIRDEEGEMLSADSTTEAPAAARVFPLPKRADSARPIRFQFDEPRPAVALELVLDDEQTERQIARAECAQFLIYALLITIVGYVIFAPSYVGTFTDIAKVFFWGFSLDIGSSALTKVIAQAKLGTT